MNNVGIGIGVSVFCLWMTNFIISLTFPTLLSTLDLSVTFFIFTIFCIVAIKFVKKFVPETKGAMLEELEDYFRTKGKKTYYHNGKLKEAK
ncbi:MFS transporter [Rummeliibacillus sp. JY-2-4R]